jgi:hypothetical protein
MSGQEIEWLERVPLHQPVWLFFSLFILIGFFAWIRLYYGNILMPTIQASANFQVASRMFKDNSLLQKQLDNVLYVFYFLSIGFFTYVIETRFQWHPYGFSGIKLFLLNLALLTGVFLSRVILVNMAGFLFNKTRIFREYLYNNFIFNKLLGMALLPFLVLSIYTNGTLREIFIWTALALAGTVFTMRLIRGVIFSFKKGVSIFYMFLYLCALELAPLVLLYRWLDGVL